MASTVKERLLEFLKEERISASEFSRRMNLSPAYLASMRKSMPEEKVERLMKIFPQLNRDWLLYGEGNMYREDLEEQGLAYHYHRHLVPLIPNHATAGRFPDYAEGMTEEKCEKIYSPFDDAELAIQVLGDSMEPEIKSGTYLFLRKINDSSFIPWGAPVVLDTDNGSVCKMLHPSEKGEEYVEARSYNPVYPPFPVHLETVYGIYRIVGEVRKYHNF